MFGLVEVLPALATWFVSNGWAWLVRLDAFGVERVVCGAPIYSIYCRECVTRISEFAAHVHWPRFWFVGKAHRFFTLELTKIGEVCNRWFLECAGLVSVLPAPEQFEILVLFGT